MEHPERIYLSAETLAYLETTLLEHQDQPAVIFLHCPLYDTVLDRDPQLHRDYNTLQHFFAPENSDAVRKILAAHQNASVFISGHTHSGWGAPNLVKTEQLGDHPVTFVNVMSPWYTGTHTGPRLGADHATFNYIPDEPDVVVSFSFQIFSDTLSIRAREHTTRRWLQEWRVPMYPA